MAFQNLVNFNYAIGVPGELYTNSPVTADNYLLDSASAANNIYGRAFTIKSEGVAQVGNPGDDAVFAGILANPKDGVLYGDGTNPLAASLAVPNDVTASLVTEGTMVVSLAAKVGGIAIGELVIFDNTTGALETIARGANLPAAKSFAYAEVVKFTIAATGGLAVIRLTPTLTIPVRA